MQSIGVIPVFGVYLSSPFQKEDRIHSKVTIVTTRRISYESEYGTDKRYIKISYFRSR